MGIAYVLNRCCCEPRRHRLIHEHANREESAWDRRRRRLLPPAEGSAEGDLLPADAAGVTSGTRRHAQQQADGAASVRARRVRLPPPPVLPRSTRVLRTIARYMSRHSAAVDERLVALASVTTATVDRASNAMAVASSAAVEAQDARVIVEALRYPSVELWMRQGLVQIGVALPEGMARCCSRVAPFDVAADSLPRDVRADCAVDMSTWDAVELGAVTYVGEAAGTAADGFGHESRTVRVLAIGTGFCVDARGAVLTGEHVRGLAQWYISWAADAGYPGGRLVFAMYTPTGDTDWSCGWEACVLAYTEDWNAENGSYPPDPHVRPLQGFANPLSPTQRYADAALICATRELASGARVSVEPGSALPIPRVMGQSDTADADSATTLCVMPRGIAGPRLGEPLWALGYPAQLGSSRVMATECRLANTCEDEHGEWLQIVGKVLPGHSGGPIVNASAGAVVAWVVRECFETGMTHARHVTAAQPCIDAGLAALDGATWCAYNMAQLPLTMPLTDRAGQLAASSDDDGFLRNT